MSDRRGGARAGAGRKPGSKNKLTAKVKKTLTELAQEYTQEAIETLASVMRDEGETGSARISAANSILDRGHGKPVQANVDLDPEKVELPFDGWAIGRVQPD